MVRRAVDGLSDVERPTSVGVVLLLVLIAGAGLRYAVVNPVRNYQLDFRAYYAAGRALHMGINPYDGAAVREGVQLPGSQSMLMYLYPPPTLAITYGLAMLPFPAAQVPWAVFQYLLGIGALVLLWRAAGCAFGSPVSVLIAVAFLLSGAVTLLFQWGQFDMIVLALVAGAVLALVRQRSLWAGVLLGLAAVAKVTPAAFVVVLLVRREWKALLGFGMTIGVLMGSSYLVLGDEVFGQWRVNLEKQPNHLASMISPQNMSLHGFVLRGLVDYPQGPNPSRAWIELGMPAAGLIRWGLTGLLWLATIAWLLRWRRELSTSDAIAALVPVILLSSPLTWMHHGVQVVVPLAAMVAVAGRQRRLSRFDLGWISVAILMFMIWPVQRFDLQLPDWMSHLLVPMLTYGMVLTWLFMVVRYVPLKLAQSAEERPQTAGAAARPTTGLAMGCS